MSRNGMRWTIIVILATTNVAVALHRVREAAAQEPVEPTKCSEGGGCRCSDSGPGCGMCVTYGTGITC